MNLESVFVPGTIALMVVLGVILFRALKGATDKKQTFYRPSPEIITPLTDGYCSSDPSVRRVWRETGQVLNQMLVGHDRLKLVLFKTDCMYEIWRVRLSNGAHQERLARIQICCIRDWDLCYCVMLGDQNSGEGDVYGLGHETQMWADIQSHVCPVHLCTDATIGGTRGTPNPNPTPASDLYPTSSLNRLGDAVRH